MRIGMVASAFFFALMHGPTAPIIFPSGIVFAYLYERSGSLLPSAIVHGMINAVATGLYLAFWFDAA